MSFAGSVLDGMCVDFVTGLVFYTDTGEDVISVMSLDGQYSRDIVNHGLKEPRAIVADYAEGYTKKLYL